LLALGAAAATPTARQVRAKPATPIADDLPARLDAVVRPYAASGQFSGAVLVARGGETLLRAGYGTANRITGAENTPATSLSDRLALESLRGARLRAAAGGRLALAR
jgi:CubicO group peptidase (beta-lactamase class C family)